MMQQGIFHTQAVCAIVTIDRWVAQMVPIHCIPNHYRGPPGGGGGGGAVESLEVLCQLPKQSAEYGMSLWLLSSSGLSLLPASDGFQCKLLRTRNVQHPFIQLECSMDALPSAHISSLLSEAGRQLSLPPHKLALQAIDDYGKLQGLDAMVYKEHIDYDLKESTNPAFGKAVVRVNIYRQHRQVQYTSMTSHWLCILTLQTVLSGLTKVIASCGFLPQISFTSEDAAEQFHEVMRTPHQAHPHHEDKTHSWAVLPGW